MKLQRNLSQCGPSRSYSLHLHWRRHQTFVVNPDACEVRALNKTHEVVKTGSRDKKMNKVILEVEQHATVSFEPRTCTAQ